MNRKPIFDAIRELLKRGISASEVRKIDAAIDEALGVKSGLTIGPKGIALIKEFEGYAKERSDGSVEAYLCPAGVWTIGFGSTGAGIGKGTVWTRAQADDWFDKHIQRYAKDVAQAIGDAPTTQEQFDALVSFHYNTGAIGTATLTKKHKAGDYAGAAAEFARWNKGGGRVLPGLTRRRAAEAALYRS